MIVCIENTDISEKDVLNLRLFVLSWVRKKEGAMTEVLRQLVTIP